jgi:N-acetylglucosaminyldiphosphoundecaprenol N-acetyl-beta-D-mannosaminyltransferase
MNNRRNLLGVPIDIFQLSELISKLEGDIKAARVSSVISINPEKIMCAQKDKELLSALKESDYLIPDGIGTVIGMRLIYGLKVVRITGIGLVQNLLDLAEKKKYKVFVFGSKHLTNSKAINIIKERHPSLDIVGSKHGYIQEEDENDLIKEINFLGTDILFVGLGSPKQEKWIYQKRGKIRAKICMGIGGSLDVIAETLPRAPSWVQIVGLEWLFRLIREPGRIRRQLVLPKFAFRLMKQRILASNLK